MPEIDEKDKAEEREVDEKAASSSSESPDDAPEEGSAAEKPARARRKSAPVRAKAAAEDAEDEGEEGEPEESDEAGESDGEDEDVEEDAAAARVAEALGLDEGGSEDPAAAVEEEPVRNRAVRRREEALQRRRKKKGVVDEPATTSPARRTAADEDEALPKDKNARAKELLRRRREEAAGRRPVDLLPSEMVDDALSRMASSTGRWVRENFSFLQWAVVGAAVIGGGILLYTHFGEQSAMAASSALAAAVADERGKVMADDKRSDDEKEMDTAKVFKTTGEREDAALAGYNQVIDKYKGSGPAILAKLGQAGVYLDKKDFPHALEAYSSVLATTLAAADPDVKGRAIEGIGFAKEGKGDSDGALASFKELEGVDVKPYKELSLYHQARIRLAKGDKDGAKELLKSAREKLQPTGSKEGHPFQFLEAVVDDELRKIDPSAVPARSNPNPMGGGKGNQMSPEEIQVLMKRAQEAAERKAKENGGK